MLANDYNPLWVKVLRRLLGTSTSLINCLLCSFGNYWAATERWFSGVNLPFCEGWTLAVLLRSMEARL